MALAEGKVKGRHIFTVPGSRVCSLLQQHLGDGSVPSRSHLMQGCPQLLALMVDVRTAVQAGKERQGGAKRKEIKNKVGGLTARSLYSHVHKVYDYLHVYMIKGKHCSWDNCTSIYMCVHRCVCASSSVCVCKVPSPDVRRLCKQTEEFGKRCLANNNNAPSF